MTADRDTLTAAATALRQLHTEARPVPWNPVSVEEDNRATIYCGPRQNGYLQGVVLDMGEDCEECTRPSPADLRLMCDLRDAAVPLAALFENMAWILGLAGEFAGRVGVEEAVAVARAVLSGTENPAAVS